MTHTCILLFIPLLLWFDIYQYVSADVYYATPTCPEGDVSCMTLSQYATQPNNYFASNTTLILLPGNHILDLELRIANITNLTIFSSIPDTTVTCYQSARFIFRGVGHINISGITFFGCMNNTIISVEDFALENCNFDGQYREGTAVYLQLVPNAIISNNSFSSNTGYKVVIDSWVQDHALFGGAMITKNSKVLMLQCVFTDNYVNNNGSESDDAFGGGGAVYIVSSDVMIGNCKFISNTVDHCYGGALYVMDSGITISNCTFVNNTAIFGGGGGAVACDNCSLILNSSAFINNTALINNQHADNDDGSAGGAVYIGVGSSSPVVFVDNCEFTNNKADLGGGAVNVEMETAPAVMLLTIKDSVFTNNYALFALGGALVATGDNLTVDISNCVFRNNIAYGGGALFVQVNVVTISGSMFINNRAISGGGAIVVSSGIYCNVTVHGSTSFINNSAHNIGGAIGSLSCSSISLMNDTTFSFNSASQGSALYLQNSTLSTMGIFKIHNNVANNSVVYVSQCTVSLSGTIIISNNIGSVFVSNSNMTLSGNTTFMNNSYSIGSQFGIQEGGAITSFQSNLYLYDTVDMLYNEADNGGAILATGSKVYMYGNITISGNRALQSGGGISAFQSEFSINHYVTVIANTAEEKGGGMHIIGSRVILLNQLMFTSNNSSRGGGVCLELNSKISITKISSESNGDGCYSGEGNSNHNTWPRIVFTNNSADYGGAVYITDDTNSGTCSATPYTQQSATSECFFQVLALYSLHCPCELDDQNLINLNFSNNTATAKGNTIFGGLLDRCTVNPFAEYSQVLYCNQSFHPISGLSYLLNVTDLKPIDFRSEISSNPVRVCFCKDSQRDCNYQPPTMSIMRGSLFTVSLVAVDQVNNIVPNATIHSSLSSGLGRLSERQAIQNTTETCTRLQYNIFSSSSYNNETLLLYAEGPCKDTGISASRINIKFQNCPVGFQLGKGDCSCDPALTFYITNCSISSQTVQRKSDTWITYINDSNRGVGFIIKPHCPFDYCRPNTDNVYINFNIRNGADAQCAFNRTGILCGSCGKNLSLSLGSSHCMSCSNDWLALLIPFAIAGIALVAFLLVLNLTVAVGTINGLIFYANITVANRAIFFPFNKPNFLTVFIAWLNLDFGFETCFYDGMDGLAKVWLQLVFPSYIILLVTVVIMLCEYFHRFSRLLSYTNPVATLATLILLSYAKLLRTTIAALSFTTLEYPNGSHTVWLYDANIPYLDRKHIGLFVVALLILIIGLVYTFLLLFWQFLLRAKIIDWMRNNHNTIYTWYNIWIRRYLYSFMDVYHAPYNTSHRYWTGLLLLLRGVVYIISAVNVFGDPSVNLLSISCVVMLLLVWKLNVHMTIYKGRFQNKLDIIQLVNLVLLSAGTFYIRAVDSGNQAALAYTSTSIAFITFLCILCYHAKGIPQYVYKLAKIKPNFQPQPDQRDYDEIVAGTAEERLHLVSSICSQTEVDGLPDRDKGSQDEEN